MKKNIWLTLAAIAVSLGFAAAVQANPIVGSAGFAGNYIQNGTVGDLTTATSMHITSISVQNADGDFVAPGVYTPGVQPALISWLTDIGVNGNLGNNLPAGNVLFKILNILTGNTYTFTLTSESQPFTSKTALSLQGGGIVTMNAGLNPTPGTWGLNFGVSGTSFTWSDSTSTIPDGGTTAMLLGGVLAGLGLLRRKLMA
jgi:hypothetical protein